MKQLKAEGKSVALQQQVILELNTLVKDIERSEKTLTSLKQELAAVNSRYQGPRTTREDIAYLTGLLECAKKKLAWEKQIASLQKRTPSLMQRMTTVMQDTQNPPSPETCQHMHHALKLVQAAMDRLQSAEPGLGAGASEPAA